MPKTILIVDDINVNRHILRHMLAREYNVLEAENGEDALALLARTEPPVSAVLLDIHMPGMDGYEVLRRMRENSDWMQIPVVMITGSDDEAAQNKSLSLGANDFVMKPYKPDIIRHCIETNIALQESAAAAPALKRDPLTGLYNRESFFHLVQEMVGAREPGYYIMACFDIDNFKMVNDQYGTQTGNAVLRHIGEVFKRGFGPNGGICSRVFADNFAVLYPASFQASPEIKEIRQRAKHVDGLIAPLLFSIGRYAVEDLSLTPSAMYDRANLAADSVKGRYDNKIAQYDASMRDRLLREQSIVPEMKSALKARQFEVWFQPQYNHSTHAMIGAEALVRWRHPRDGLIPPGAFIPLFENNGFIYALDQFVWREVCRYLRKWLDEGRNPLPVSVNISRYDVLRPDVFEVVTGLIDEYGIPKDLLRLEITESAFSASAQQIIDVVKAFIDYGLTVEIDDFGTGFSSLNTLKDVPAQILKLDMKFLENSGDSSRGGNIVESVVRMAKWLGMSVIAEGVETLKQANYLRSIGCSYMQGYLFARPMPVDQYEAHCKGVEKEERLLKLETVENLNNNAFWDPDSMDTLIFNSFVGGACIYEYHNGSIELLRATEKYAQIIGSAGMTVEDALKLDWSEHLDKQTAVRIAEDLQKSILTNNEVTGEYIFLNLPGCPHETHLRSTMRVIASAGSRYLVYCTNENITAQRQAEKREREVAEEIRLILANVNSGICASVREPNGDFRILFANDRFYAMYGYTKEQMEAELGSVLGAVHPDDVERVAATMENLLHGGGQATYEYRCVKRDGSVITVQCNNTVAAFPGIGEKVLLAVIYDVTERVASEQRMRRLSEQMQIIMRNVNGGISAMTVDDRGVPHIIFANEKYYALTGYTRRQAEAEMPDLRDMVHPEDKPIAKASITKLLEDGLPNEAEYRCVKRDGSVIYVRSSKSITSVEGYGDKVVISVLTDITAPILSEQRERRVAEQLKFIMDNVDVGIVASVFDHGNLRFLFANDKYYEMRGYTRAQFESEISDPHSIVIPEDRERVKNETVRITSAGESIVMVYEIVRRDGARRHIRNTISIGHFEGVGAPIQLSILRDITEEKAAELREKRANEQAQSIMNDIDSGLTATVLQDGKVEVLFSNEQFYAMRGYTQAQYYAEVKDFYALVHPDDRARVRQAAVDIYTSDKPIRQEYRVMTRDGGERWMRVNMTLTRFTGVEQPVILRVHSDVTVEKKAELAAKNATAQLRSLMDNLPGGAGVCELKT